MDIPHKNSHSNPTQQIARISKIAYNKSTLKIPGRKIFILASTCLVIVAISVVIKFRLDRTDAENQKPQILSATSSNALASIRDLISKSELDAAFATTTNPFAPADGDTLTDSLSKEIFTSYMQSDSQGLLDSPAGANQIAEKVISNIDTQKLPQNTYTFEQIQIFNPKIAGDLYTYGNTYAKAEVGNLSVIRDNPEKYENDLIAIADVYKKISVDLMKVKTPLIIAVNHLAIANAYGMMAESLINISNSQSDPLKATLSIKVFKEAASTQSENYLEIASYLQDNGIIFPENQLGRMFNKSTGK